MTLNDFCPFKCPWLNCNEDQQNHIHKTMRIFPMHRCTKFDTHLYHNGYAPWIVKCSECNISCTEPSSESNLLHSYAVFKDGTRVLITAWQMITRTDLLFSIKNSNYTYLFKTCDFDTFDIDLRNTDKIRTTKKPTQCFYYTELEEIVNPIFSILSENYWIPTNEIDHIEIYTGKGT